MNGRAGRQEWWFGFLGAHALGLAIERAAGSVVVDAVAGSSNDDLHLLIVAGLVRAATIVGVVLVQYRISVRRAHDRNVALVTLWPYAGLYAATMAWAFFQPLLPYDLPGFWVPVLLMAGWLGYQLGVKPGDRGSNVWGSPPKPIANYILPKPDNYRSPRH